MQIVIRREDYSAIRYTLGVGDSALTFAAEQGSFRLPYRDLHDFCITQEARGKAYFTAISAGRLYEGQILEPREIKAFVAALNEKLGGVINIEVKKI